MSEIGYLHAPTWNNDGLRPNGVNSNVFPTPMGWMGPMPGTKGTVVTNTTWASGGGGVATITASGHAIVSGQDGMIYGVSPAGYNGYYPNVTVVDINTVTVPVSVNPGAYASGGVLNHRGEVMHSIGVLDQINADLSVIPAFSGATFSYSNLAHMVTGDIATVTLNASENVAINVNSGVPTVTMTVNGATRAMTFSASGSTATSLAFKYVVTAADVAAAGQVVVGTAISTNGGQMVDLAPNTGGEQYNHPGVFTPGSFTAPVTSTIAIN